MVKVFPKVDPGKVAELQRVRADLAEKGNLSVHYETFRNITKHFHSGLIGGGSSSDESGSAHSTGFAFPFLPPISLPPYSQLDFDHIPFRALWSKCSK
ncbi:hypothetical protein PVK06_020272 [Gossypium arboreum]|uniref:Uncharacterized protein n=1 Tax=Gossypium arboreum TaxID=29729 RepID=A0ABR0PLY5_GOSAR|nr:hypothetical protein PVK06_020272 [Gossypium arboreum]